jgi:GNAT superfamily N-acetyltransferase
MTSATLSRQRLDFRVGAVPALGDVEPGVDFPRQVTVSQVAAQEDGLLGAADLQYRLIGRVVGCAGEPAQDRLGGGRARPDSGGVFPVTRSLPAPRVAFFSIREDGAAAGCGGTKLFGGEYGEIKRTYVRPEFRGRGFGKLMLDHLATHAKSRGIDVLRLETGIHQHAAIR